MEKEKTYEELMQCVPADVKEKFREIEQGKRLSAVDQEKTQIINELYQISQNKRS